VPSSRALPVAAALATVLFWASAFVGIRSAGHSFSPGALALGRLLVGSVILGAVVLVRREPLPPARVLPAIAGIGLLWFAAYSVALNSAERRLDAGTASMLVNIGPILIAVLAGLFLGEGFPRSLLLGLAIGFGGVAVIALADEHRGVSLLGTVLCLAAAAAYATAIVFQKRAVRHVSPLQLTWLCCCVGALACLAFAPSLVHQLGRAPSSRIAWVVYLGAFPTAVAFTTWAYALAHTDASRLGATTYLVPPISILLGWALLGETPAGLAVAGGALCFAGVLVSRRSGSSPRFARRQAGTRRIVRRATSS
jgi:drug/metabolite transporter (DMT)-like permease